MLLSDGFIPEAAAAAADSTRDAYTKMNALTALTACMERISQMVQVLCRLRILLMPCKYPYQCI